MKYCLVISFLFSTLLSKATDHVASSVEEVNRFCNIAKAGDKILLKAGVYKDAFIRFENNNGTEKDPVIFCAMEPGQVFF